MYHGKRVLILGGLGFIGSNLAQCLVKRGAIVTLFDNFLPDHGANLFNIDGIHDQVQIQTGDIRHAEDLKSVLPNQDWIVNLAAQTSHSDSMRDPFLDVDINARGNLVFLESCRMLNPHARIAFVGTRAYYGAPLQASVNEETAIHPLDVYAVNRFAAEQYHWVYAHHYGLWVCSLRLGNLYGPRAQMKHPRYNVLNYFMRLALEKRALTIYGEGHQVRDYLYIDDACEAILSAVSQAQAKGQIYNVGTGQGITFKALAQEIVSLAGQGHLEHIPWPAGSQAFDVGDVQMEIGKIAHELGWKPQTTLRNGLQQTLNYYREYAHHYWS